MISDADLHRILDEGLAHWNAGRYFECHDKLEEAWKEVKHEKKAEKASDPRRDFLHGLILLAAGCVHWQRGNPVGVRRKFEEALRLLSAYPHGFLGVEWGPVGVAARQVLKGLPELGPVRMPILARHPIAARDDDSKP